MKENFEELWDERKEWIEIEKKQFESEHGISKDLDIPCTCDIDPITCLIHGKDIIDEYKEEQNE